LSLHSLLGAFFEKNGSDKEGGRSTSGQEQRVWVVFARR
jgi:hypothetical protein